MLKGPGTLAAIAATLAVADAEPLPQPKVGTCPERLPRERRLLRPDEREVAGGGAQDGQCPSGFMQSGNYCIDTRRR